MFNSHPKLKALDSMTGFALLSPICNTRQETAQKCLFGNEHTVPQALAKNWQLRENTTAVRRMVTPSQSRRTGSSRRRRSTHWPGVPMALISYRGRAPGNGAGRAQQAQRIALWGGSTSRLSKQGL
jgi:hypothetical protein